MRKPGFWDGKRLSLTLLVIFTFLLVSFTVPYLSSEQALQMNLSPTAIPIENSRVVEKTYKISSELWTDTALGADSSKVLHSEVASTEVQPAASASPYILEIKGDSSKMSSKAWSNMLEWRKAAVELAAKFPNRLVLNGPDRERKAVALTFDDGPDAAVTPAVLDVLLEYGVPASFFFVGERIVDHPEVVKRAFKEGHLILNHSNTHSRMTTLGPEELREELRRTDDLIELLTGERPQMFRPPYGDLDEPVLMEVEAVGHKTVLWSLDTLDWSLKDREGIVNNVRNYVRNGDILLMHSSKPNQATAEALPLIIEELQRGGYEMVALDKLLEE